MDEYLHFDDPDCHDPEPRRVPETIDYPPFLQPNAQDSDSAAPMPTAAPAAGPFQDVYEFNDMGADMLGESDASQHSIHGSDPVESGSWNGSGWADGHLTVSPFQVGGWHRADVSDTDFSMLGGDERLMSGDGKGFDSLMTDGGVRGDLLDHAAASGDDDSVDSDAMSVSSIGVASPKIKQTKRPIAANDARQSASKLPEDLESQRVRKWADRVVQEGISIDRMLAQEPKLTDKDRRKYRNKIASRISRTRRKDFGTDFEAEAINLRAENEELKQKLAKYEKECGALRRELKALKKRAGFEGMDMMDLEDEEEGPRTRLSVANRRLSTPASGTLRNAVEERKQNLNGLLKKLTAPTSSPVNVAYATSASQMVKSNPSSTVPPPEFSRSSTPTPSMFANPSGEGIQRPATPNTPSHPSSSSASQNQQKLHIMQPAPFCNPTTSNGWAQNRVKVHSVFVSSPVLSEQLTADKIKPETDDRDAMRSVRKSVRAALGGALSQKCVTPLTAEALVSLAGFLPKRNISKAIWDDDNHSLIKSATRAAIQSIKLRELALPQRVQRKSSGSNAENGVGNPNQIDLSVLTKLLIILLLSMERVCVAA